ncbi:hypothetical protein [Nonomuraea typhae]|uniref:Uncharacterized protein n=1 Tax=Nonomuraea typhae TaxID=2603600 RepID=A0ABW7YK05_9ACTN
MTHELVVSYDENKGYRVVSAPKFAQISGEVLRRADGLALKVELGMITVAEQVVYRRGDHDVHRDIYTAELVRDLRKSPDGDWWTPPGWKRPEEVSPRYVSESPELEIEVMSLDLDELVNGWITFWELWGPSEHLFRSVNIIEIAYAVFEMSEGDDPYRSYDDLMAHERLLRKIIKDKLLRQYWRPDDDRTQSDAYGLAARLMKYVREHPRSKA